MRMNIPKNDDRFIWTNHVVGKMMHYGLSAQKVKSVLNDYKRKEEGIAPNTVAVMKSAGSAKRPAEVWVMYQRVNPVGSREGARRKPARIRVISAWRYPGKSPIGRTIHIPDDTLELLQDLNDGEPAAEV